MLSRVYTSGIVGIDGFEVVVECSSWKRIPRFDLVGLPDAAVKEALASHTMNHLQITIRMFLLLMKGRIYAVCYLICKLFFNK
jgi:hypothetical protein